MPNLSLPEPSTGRRWVDHAEAGATGVMAPRDTLVIDLDNRTVAAGPWSASLEAEQPGPDDILARYLALVYVMRGIDPGTEIPLRTLDVSVLARATELPSVEVEDRLVLLMQPGNRRLDAVRRVVKNKAAITAAVAVAATAIGLLILVPGGDASPQPPGGPEAPGPAPVSTANDGVEFAPHPIEPEIGEGLTIER